MPGWLNDIANAVNPWPGLDKLVVEPVGAKLTGASSPQGGGPLHAILEPTAKKAPTKKAPKAPKAPSTASETAAIEKELSTGPWAEISKALVSQYDTELAPVEAAVSGATGNAAQAGAANQALASLGLSSGSAGGQWLTSQLAAANANAAPVDAAMASYGNQYAAEAGPISKALLAYGQANELNVASAPEQAWLNALASHITSNLSYYGEVPSAAVSSIPGGVVEALQQSGGFPGGASTGLTPLGSLSVTPEGSVKVPKGSATGLSTASLGGGTVPGAGTNAGTG